MKKTFMKFFSPMSVIIVLCFSISDGAYADIMQEIDKARSAHAKREFGRAIEIYTNIISDGLPDTHKEAYPIYANRGLAYAMSGKLRLAVEDYNKAMDIYFARYGREDAHGLSLRGVVYYHLGELDLAIQDYEASVNLVPDYEPYRETLKKLKAKKKKK